MGMINILTVLQVLGLIPLIQELSLTRLQQRHNLHSTEEQFHVRR